MQVTKERKKCFQHNRKHYGRLVVSIVPEMIPIPHAKYFRLGSPNEKHIIHVLKVIKKY